MHGDLQRDRARRRNCRPRLAARRSGPATRAADDPGEADQHAASMRRRETLAARRSAPRWRSSRTDSRRSPPRRCRSAPTAPPRSTAAVAEHISRKPTSGASAGQLCARRQPPRRAPRRIAASTHAADDVADRRRPSAGGIVSSATRIPRYVVPQIEADEQPGEIRESRQGRSRFGSPTPDGCSQHLDVRHARLRSSDCRFACTRLVSAGMPIIRIR